jgi:hypothetical protein
MAQPLCFMHAVTFMHGGIISLAPLQELSSSPIRPWSPFDNSFTFGLGASVHVRLSVAKRVGTAMGIKHLRVDPLKRGEDDFISDDACKLIKAEAEKKQNLTWAKQGDFPRSKAGSFRQATSEEDPLGWQEQQDSQGRPRQRRQGRSGQRSR